ncbi:DNA-3-methyladenine glycosylase 2 family protein [Paraburkholderia sp. Tr-20389]|uniref:DNA-3-methyladenine glycosylase family protein n=1 Tax=Paraburkholderia sp. Tr-20389 TaxID=2703903 RepID=UPI00197E2A45|nr:endonuclease III domain-containing protein [Paraburkholderia sp. Tr-20389]MBN3753403.1 DNA-3-methyladenine glycosylase 2 family protein [Paraburkholderia sp. Tr-20389]
MATATKTPAKRAASQSDAASKVRAVRARNGVTAKGAAKVAVKSASAKGVKAGALARPVPTRSHVNGADAPEAAAVKPSRARTAHAKGNGSLPAGLAGDLRDTAHDNQEVEPARKPRAAVSSAEGVDAVQAAQPSVVTRPAYWDKACADLVKRDRILKKLIPKFGPVHLSSRADPFVTLARSVIGQQISVASAQAMWQRIVAACPKLVPQQIIKLGQGDLMGCGVSKRKAEYILDLAHHFVSGALHVGKWTSMEDEGVIAELTQIRGISRWTAEMFLIFDLSRPDVLPLDDPNLIHAISQNYFSGEPVTRSEAREVAANWEPWRTVATWYMWRSLDPAPAGN